MGTLRTFLAAAVTGAAVTASGLGQTPLHDRAVLADFAGRLQTYVELKAAAAQTVLPIVSLTDVAEIQRRTEALATVIRSARGNARQGDLFTADVQPLIRRAIHAGCEGEYAALVLLIREELTDPPPAPAIHGRWPAAVPVPTMLPGLLAALPPLPANLQYRFMGTALVLIDIDANLILDFVPDAIPITTAPTPH